MTLVPKTVSLKTPPSWQRLESPSESRARFTPGNFPFVAKNALRLQSR